MHVYTTRSLKVNQTTNGNNKFLHSSYYVKEILQVANGSNKKIHTIYNASYIKSNEISSRASKRNHAIYDKQTGNKLHRLIHISAHTHTHTFGRYRV